MAGGRYVAGLTWHFAVDGVDQTQIGNCVSISTQLTTGTINVSGSADGLSASTTLAIAAARTTNPGRARREVRSPAGDRARADVM